MVGFLGIKISLNASGRGKLRILTLIHALIRRKAAMATGTYLMTSIHYSGRGPVNPPKQSRSISACGIGIRAQMIGPMHAAVLKGVRDLHIHAIIKIWVVGVRQRRRSQFAY